MTKSLKFFNCPVCGAQVPSNAPACPECGADDTTGWNAERAVYDGLNLPDDEFDYDAYLRGEFGGARKPAAGRWKWLGVIGLILVLIVLLLARRHCHGCVILGGSLGEFALPSAISSEMVGRGVPAEPSFPRMTQPRRHC